MKARMTLATVAAVAGLTLVGAAPVSADPEDGVANGSTFDIVCDTLGTVTTVFFSNAAASPGLVVDSNQVILAYEWQGSVTFTPTNGEPFTRPISYSRGEPQNGRLDQCTFHFVRVRPTGVAVFDGLILISYTP